MEARFYVPIIGILASVVLCIQGQGQGGVRIAQCEINNSPNQQTFRLGRCEIGTLVHKGHNQPVVWFANILNCTLDKIFSDKNLIFKFFKFFFLKCS